MLQDTATACPCLPHLDEKIRSFQGLLGGCGSMYEHNLYLSALFELLQTQTTMPIRRKPVPVPQPFHGEITFERVSFNYQGAERLVLHDVSFTIKPGEIVAIVGRNGAGKTTLIKLLTRLYDPTAGRILIDGIDIRAYDPNELRKHLGTMLQDFVAYQFTARENIGLGRHEKLDDQAAIVQAAAASGADEVIARLPAGYESVLGKWFDQGVNLSGGEWQKLALARSVMRNASILILDEPTAALDAQAEQELFARLREVIQGHTAIFISHRYSTVRIADRILVFENGSLVEQGTQRELLASDGTYAHLFNMQASSYIREE